MRTTRSSAKVDCPGVINNSSFDELDVITSNHELEYLTDDDKEILDRILAAKVVSSDELEGEWQRMQQKAVILKVVRRVVGVGVWSTIFQPVDNEWYRAIAAAQLAMTMLDLDVEQLISAVIFSVDSSGRFRSLSFLTEQREQLLKSVMYWNV